MTPTRDEIKLRLGRSYDAQCFTCPLLRGAVTKEQYVKANIRSAMKNLRDFGESLERFAS